MNPTLVAPEAPAAAQPQVRFAKRDEVVGGSLVRGSEKRQAQQDGDKHTEAEDSHRNVAMGEDVDVGGAQTRRSWRGAGEGTV